MLYDASCELFSGIWENDIVSSSSFVGTSHGMYVAGIICSNADKDEYVSVLNNAKLYYIEIDSEVIDISQLITDLKNAQEAGAKVVNCSFVTTKYYKELYDFIIDSACTYIINEMGCSAKETKEILLDSSIELITLDGKVKNSKVLSFKGILNYIQAQN